MLEALTILGHGLLGCGLQEDGVRVLLLALCLLLGHQLLGLLLGRLGIVGPVAVLVGRRRVDDAGDVARTAEDEGERPNRGLPELQRKRKRTVAEECTVGGRYNVMT